MSSVLSNKCNNETSNDHSTDRNFNSPRFLILLHECTFYLFLLLIKRGVFMLISLHIFLNILPDDSTVRSFGKDRVNSDDEFVSMGKYLK